MILVGLILVAAAVVVAALLIAQSAMYITVSALGWHLTVHAYWLVVAGMVLTAAVLIGLTLIRGATARSARLRRERRALAHENEMLAEAVARHDTVAGSPMQMAPASGPNAGFEQSGPYEPTAAQPTNRPRLFAHRNR